MRNIVRLAIILLSVLVLAACNTQPLVPSATAVPTQTPIIIVITATASFTPIPTQTSLPTSTATATQTATQSIFDRCSFRTAWPVYQVQLGDTLSSIAARTNSTVTTLQLANCIANRNIIQVGQKLYVPKLPEEDVPVEDLISAFSLNVSEAHAGDSITFSWEAESGTIVQIKHVTANNIVIGSNLSATGSLTYTLPADLGDLTQLEFVINGIKAGDDGNILAEPLSVFLDVLDNEPEVTTEPELTDEPEVTDVPEVTDEPQVTTEPEVTEEAA